MAAMRAAQSEGANIAAPSPRVLAVPKPLSCSGNKNAYAGMHLGVPCSPLEAVTSFVPQHYVWGMPTPQQQQQLFQQFMQMTFFCYVQHQNAMMAATGQQSPVSMPQAFCPPGPLPQPFTLPGRLQTCGLPSPLSHAPSTDLSRATTPQLAQPVMKQVLVRKDSSAALTAAAPSSGMASPAVASQSPVGGAATACADIDMSKLAQPAYAAKSPAASSDADSGFWQQQQQLHGVCRSGSDGSTTTETATRHRLVEEATSHRATAARGGADGSSSGLALFDGAEDDLLALNMEDLDAAMDGFADLKDVNGFADFDDNFAELISVPPMAAADAKPPTLQHVNSLSSSMDSDSMTLAEALPTVMAATVAATAAAHAPAGTKSKGSKACKAGGGSKPRRGNGVRKTASTRSIKSRLSAPATAAVAAAVAAAEAATAATRQARCCDPLTDLLGLDNGEVRDWDAILSPGSDSLMTDAIMTAVA